MQASKKKKKAPILEGAKGGSGDGERRQGARREASCVSLLQEQWRRARSAIFGVGATERSTILHGERVAWGIWVLSEVSIVITGQSGD